MNSLLPCFSPAQVAKVLVNIFCIILLLSCKDGRTNDVVAVPAWERYDETEQLTANKEHPNPRMRYQLIQSKVLDKNDIWDPISEDIADFTEEDYQRLKPLVLERDMPALQRSINEGVLTYEQLTKFFLYRIRKIENDSTRTLHSVIALNPIAVQEARKRDLELKNKKKKHAIFGMPILLKDNINTARMPTTAGAIALQNNQPEEDAFIVKKLEEAGAIVLGKANLSEWAYYFCSGCPVGYSAVGGQTLNPYGRMQFESGGSSSGSGTTVAANYAVAAVGTETSGSILSPSSQNSVVGLKPTIGLLSRTGIVPISSTLDTPGPMTKSVIDNAILLSAMIGEDAADRATRNLNRNERFDIEAVMKGSLDGKRLGAIKQLMERDSIYKLTINRMKDFGAEIVEVTQPEVPLEGFLTLLNVDMKIDLPVYLHTFRNEQVKVKDVAEVVQFNLKDTLVRAPYGQALFEGILADTTSVEGLQDVKERLHANGKRFFEEMMRTHQLDAILSINNYHAGYAAVAKYPCLTVPMAYKATGEPISLTFIGKPFTELQLLQMGYAFEKATRARKLPDAFR